MAAVTLAAGAADAGAAPVAHGRAGPMPWTLTASARTIGPGVPAVCFSLLWAWGPGQPIGNGSPTCIAPALGTVTPHGTRWSFNLDREGYHGVAPFNDGGTGFNGLVILAEPKATRIEATLSDGEVIQLHARPLPRELHRAASIAWSVSNDAHRATLNFRSVIAYDAHGAVVGDYTYAKRPAR